LDVPIRQVLIEAQVVQTSDNFIDAFGINLGGASKATAGKYRVGIGGDINAANRIANSGKINGSYQGDTGTSSTTATATTGSTSTTTTTTAPTAGATPNDNVKFFDFQQPDAQGKLGLSIGKLPGGTLLDLELRASELEDKSKVLARPKLMTLDQQTASIETGTEIPYSTTAQAGASPSVTFKKAVLKLEVKPQITPNNKVLMELTISQDKPGSNYTGGVGIDTTNLKTNILVDNGETVVLGGVFTVDHNKKVNKIPFFGDIPFLGRLFRDNYEKNQRREILIFVTPKIVKQMAMNQ
jgi:type IV pilus assembly protein PilQ